MSAVLALNERDSRLIEAPSREARLAEIGRYIDELKACLCWLFDHGLTVISVEIKRGKAKPRIYVEPSARLHILFKEDCAWREREQLGTALVKYTWFAVRFGSVIEWEEVTCA